MPTARFESVAERGKLVSIADSESGMGLSNPHELFEFSSGSHVEVMMKDEAFGTFIELKKSAALSVKMSIEPPKTDDPRAKEVAERAWGAIDNIHGSLIDALHEMYSAIEYGYSVTNKVFEVIPRGEFAGLVGVKYLKTKDPAAIRFDTDPFMNIKDEGILFQGPDGREEHLPLSEFIVYTYRRRFGSPYGYPDTIRAYDRWNSKRWVNKMWDIHIERMGTGAVIMQYDENDMPSADEFTVARSFIQRKQVRSGVILPKAWTIAMHEASGDSGDIFEKAVNHRNMAIARAVFFPDQLGFSDTQTGSHAKAKVQLNIFLWPLERLHRDMEEVLQEQLINELVDANDGPQDVYPRFTFAPLTEEQKVQWLSSVMEALEKGAITKDIDIENRVRDMLELGELEELKEKRAGGSAPVEKKADSMDNPDTTGDNPDDKGDDGEFEMTAKERPLTQYEKKLDMDSIISFIDATKEAFVSAWSQQFQASINKIIETTERKNLVSTANTAGISELTMIKGGDMAKVLDRYAVASFYFGALQAKREIAKGSNFAAPQPVEIDFSTMSRSEIEAFFVEKGLVVTSAMRASISRARVRTLEAAKAENDKVLSQAKQILNRGVERGDQAWAEGEVAKLMVGLAVTGEISDRKFGPAYRLEAIGRNTFTGGFNEGRKIQFEDADVRDFIQAYQYSAVLDDATTPYCRAMDGLVLRKEELSREGFPPAHVGCRSIVIPIVSGERFTFSDIPGGIKRGTGF